MKQLIVFSLAFSFLAYSCDNNKSGTSTTNSVNSDSSSTKTRATSDTTHADFLTDAQKDSLRLTEEPDGYAWVQAYQTKVDNNESMPLRAIPNMIWISKSDTRQYMAGNDKMKLCFAIDPAKPNEVIVLLQVRKNERPKKFVYYRMKNATKQRAEQTAFCPVPYPCATTIEAVEN